MDYEITAPLPVVPLGPGCIVRIEAISPTTGAAVSGVTVASAVITARDSRETLDLTSEGSFMWVPGPEA